MKYIVNDCMDAIKSDTKLIGSVMLLYSSICHDDVMNLGNGHLCGDGDLPFQTGGRFPEYPCHV